MSLGSKFVACEPQIVLTQRRIITSGFHCKEVLHIRFPFPVAQGWFHLSASYQWSFLDSPLRRGVPLSRFERTLTSAIFDCVKAGYAINNMTFMCHNYLHSEYKVAIKSGMLCMGQIEKLMQTIF